MVRLIIKNMVCGRCITSVEQLLRKNGLEASSVKLGEVELENDPGSRLPALTADLEAAGFELLDNRNQQLIERIKNLLIQLVQNGEVEEHFSVSRYVNRHIHKDYSAVSKLFSQVEGITIEQFFILQKIEKAKEWLIYDEQSLSEIAYRLGYSSTQHLSGQFKKITGMTPSAFKKIGAAQRKPLDNLR